MREIRTLRVMWRGLETRLRSTGRYRASSRPYRAVCGYRVRYCGGLPGFALVAVSVLSDPEVAASVFGGGGFTTVTFTGVTPFSVMPNCSAVPLETSTTRPGTFGPRSVTLTRADRPFLTLVTFTVDPSGMSSAAAVCPSAWNVVPLAVFFPSN